MLFYRAAVDLSRSTLNYVAGMIRRHRQRIASSWRLLNPGRQALLVLVCLRKDETFAEISAGFAVSAPTAYGAPCASSAAARPRPTAAIPPHAYAYPAVTRTADHLTDTDFHARHDFGLTLTIDTLPTTPAPHA